MLHFLLIIYTTEIIKQLITPGEVMQETCTVFPVQLGEEAFYINRTLHPPQVLYNSLLFIIMANEQLISL